MESLRLEKSRERDPDREEKERGRAFRPPAPPPTVILCHETRSHFRSLSLRIPSHRTIKTIEVLALA
ncbi:hypothetical protein NL676_018848 [Syzygium grande]|nr:hypothetical protein NL676_018848 [Syzygium grande]